MHSSGAGKPKFEIYFHWLKDGSIEDWKVEIAHDWRKVGLKMEDNNILFGPTSQLKEIIHVGRKLERPEISGTL